MRVLAAMSGGVDSAVAAARMVDAGHDVTGVHLALSKNPQSYRSGARGCCTLEDSRDARRAADVIGIPYYVWDLAERFHADVVENFVSEYASGRTPNPCLRCNEKVKFSAVAERATALGYDAVVTGHYARIVDTPDGRELHRAIDPAKDQSYVLGVLTQGQLASAFFPLGESLKTEVRAEAKERGLSVAEKPDSHDICFVADGKTAEFVTRLLGDAPGDILDESGTKVGEHAGTHRFTIGQRKGLAIENRTRGGRKRFVLDISPVNRTVTVGPRASLAIRGLSATSPRWCGPTPTGTLDCTAQMRAHDHVVAAHVRIATDHIVVQFDDPPAAVAPGQAVVLYDGTRVIGSATIETLDRVKSIGSTAS